MYHISHLQLAKVQLINSCTIIHGKTTHENTLLAVLSVKEGAYHKYHKMKKIKVSQEDD